MLSILVFILIRARNWVGRAGGQVFLRGARDEFIFRGFIHNAPHPRLSPSLAPKASVSAHGPNSVTQLPNKRGAQSERSQSINSPAFGVRIRNPASRADRSSFPEQGSVGNENLRYDEIIAKGRCQFCGPDLCGTTEDYELLREFVLGPTLIPVSFH